MRKRAGVSGRLLRKVPGHGVCVTRIRENNKWRGLQGNGYGGQTVQGDEEEGRYGAQARQNIRSQAREISYAAWAKNTSHLTRKGRPLAAGTVAGLNRIPTFARNPISLSEENLLTLPLMSSLTRGCGIPNIWPI
jgi:hypothetical protein